MSDNDSVLNFGKSSAYKSALAERVPKAEDEEQEDSCAAFGFLRGISARALALQLRFQNGNAEWFSYNLLASWRYNPSVGLLLKFSGGDVVTLVLIMGSNLDQAIAGREVNLTDRGLQLHRITYVREMSEDELKRAGQREPSIDRIEVAEFESQDDLREYLKKTAPAFLRAPR